MPRYYLHLRRGREVALDRIGTEFHDQVTVELEACEQPLKPGEAWRCPLTPAAMLSKLRTPQGSRS